MKTLPCTDHTGLAQVLDEARDEDGVLTRDGHAVALVIPSDDDDLEWYARERDPGFLASVAEARRQAARGQTVSQDDLRRQLGLDPE
jgi:antitoxin YefM